jgi:hypothetical protein
MTERRAAPAILTPTVSPRLASLGLASTSFRDRIFLQLLALVFAAQLTITTRRQSPNHERHDAFSNQAIRLPRGTPAVTSPQRSTYQPAGSSCPTRSCPPPPPTTLSRSVLRYHVKTRDARAVDTSLRHSVVNPPAAWSHCAGSGVSNKDNAAAGSCYRSCHVHCRLKLYASVRRHPASTHSI